MLRLPRPHPTRRVDSNLHRCKRSSIPILPHWRSHTRVLGHGIAADDIIVVAHHLIVVIWAELPEQLSSRVDTRSEIT
ncbi:hypothetical protein DL95DRAFT_395219 [Leptodontidium sp. 2 PMI_412]|nr:hypothetical protein DL95DRAFT_395219 [Leptodontidium sp. 2 PMI_412]